MTKKHFEAIAANFWNLRVDLIGSNGADRYGKVAVLEMTAEVMADTFAGFNDEFDRGQFLSACGF